jgi:hypothetical protein
MKKIPDPLADALPSGALSLKSLLANKDGWGFVEDASGRLASATRPLGASEMTASHNDECCIASHYPTDESSDDNG